LVDLNLIDLVEHVADLGDLLICRVLGVEELLCPHLKETCALCLGGANDPVFE
jgi:hypothetical protein